MAEEPFYLEAPGEPVAPEDLRVPKARDLARVLRAGKLQYCRFLECRRVEEPRKAEAVVFEVEVELAQHLEHDIRRREQVAAVFREDDALWPEALALRADFPLVPHVNATSSVGGELPRSLCLYDEPYHEIKLSWTSIAFIERIRDWLARTARGELHAEDQPLEPLLMGPAWSLVLPSDPFEGEEESPELLGVYAVEDKLGGYTLVARRLADEQEHAGLQYVAVSVVADAKEHGIVRVTPTGLRRLRDYLAEAGMDLFGELRERFTSWRRSERFLDLLEKRLVLVVALPKTRHAQGFVETSEVWAFAFMETAGEIGERLGVWEAVDGHYGQVLGEAGPDLEGGDVDVIPLNVSYAFSREEAAALSGYGNPDRRKIVAVGVGALGSQVFMNLVRSGYGEWKTVDPDKLLPHNLARHELSGYAVGFPKADALATVANETIEGESVAIPIVADVLSPGERSGEVTEALAQADVILDASASVAVARHLARDRETPARRVSVFFNPSGSAGVMLCEDARRASPLDWLEMQYYRWLISEPELGDHLRRPPGRIRYARSCRDLSATIPQDLVALHAAVGSRALRAALGEETARVALWSTNEENLGVEHSELAPTEAITRRVDGWTLLTDRWLLEKISVWRQKKLPNETGGVLVGAYDMERKVIYVVDALPSPPDSKEWPDLYIRGSRSLVDKVREVEEITDGQLRYVGEWHSHPRGRGPSPSVDDRRAFDWLKEHLGVEGRPATMFIVGERDVGTYVGEMP
ncbi:MAG: Mov34/MPN/PAD-1 family protein [Actinomycetota bacterium]|nr:Mov34/MPN/PAD-1 family protein [Actinomycetota bacterium]